MTQVHPAGLLLLTGGQGRRLGGPKHGQPHPSGGTWGGHVVGVFEAVFPGGPVCLVGEPLPDRPGLAALADPREGPAVALATWAGHPQGTPARRWWVAACDQVRWTPAALAEWHAAAERADPAAAHWVLAEHAGRVQYLGGFLGAGLLEAIAPLGATSMRDLAQGLATLVLAAGGDPWLDVDDPEALRAWLGRPPG